MNQAAYLVTLHGHVQGIGLRRRIWREARARNIGGWVRNRKGGHVQVFLEGDGQQVRQLIADMQTGAIGSGVTDWIVTQADAVGYDDFIIGGRDSALDISRKLVPAARVRATRFAAEFADLNRVIVETTSGVNDGSVGGVVELAEEIPARYLSAHLKKIERRLPFSVQDVSSSFAYECWAQRAQMKVLSGRGYRPPTRVLNDKGRGQDFARKLGIRVPKNFQFAVPLDEVLPGPGLAVKPCHAAGSRGVFLFFSQRQIFDLRANKVLVSEGQFFEAARKAITQGVGRPDLWTTEELVVGENSPIPNDLKMWTFYGRVALVQEETRMPTRYCYYTREGAKIRTGRYESKCFEGTGLLREYIEIAEAVSAKVPTPFLRIDLLKTKDGPIFGEFSPSPGNFHAFDAKTDCWLGRQFVEARARLLMDLLHGKKFEEYVAFVDAMGRSRQEIA